MIKSIFIKDFAIIDELRIEFNEGLSVFIGETGAGKSIIVGAINFLNAQRADISYIRKGKDRAVIEGVFTLDENTRAQLDEAEIEYEDDLIVYRTISKDGRSTIRVNGHTVTLSFLHELLKDEIDIHSQKDSQYLLRPHNHRRLLDLYMNDDQLLSEVSSAYDEYKKLDDEYRSYLEQNDNENDIEYFKYQIKEIDDAHLSVEEEEELLLFEKRYRTFQKSIDHLSEAIRLYEGDDGIGAKLYQSIKELQIDDDEIKDISYKINDKYYELEDLFSNLKAILKKIDISEDEVNDNQERLFLINRLKRKYKGSIDDILKLRAELEGRVEAFENRTSVLSRYENDIANALNKYGIVADKLHEARLKAAEKLREDIIKEMADLELRYFDFAIDVKESIMTRLGKDDVSFMISTNKGEDLKPLIKIASGGEMSRILLGLKAIFTKISGIDIVIFDEIDTGVSGKAALAMGLKMAKIAKYAQVLVITHLAQVAAFADTTYFVAKDEADDRTASKITCLNNEEKIKEMAMMASASNDEAALDAAEALIIKAKSLCR